MKTIIFSDVHLTKKFDKKKYFFLKKIAEEADHIIINGDFWDHYITKFNTFVNSEWKRLFPILKSKGTVYIFGNHDREKWTDSRVKLFSEKQASLHTLKIDDKKLIVEHGNRMIPSLDEKKIARFSIRPLNYAATKTRNALERAGLYLLGEKYFKLEKKENKKLKKYAEKLLPHEILVCGHTHLAEFDLKNRFINSGVIRHGIGQYIKIDKNKIELISQKY